MTATLRVDGGLPVPEKSAIPSPLTSSTHAAMVPSGSLALRVKVTASGALPDVLSGVTEQVGGRFICAVVVNETALPCPQPALFLAHD